MEQCECRRLSDQEGKGQRANARRTQEDADDDLARARLGQEVADLFADSLEPGVDGGRGSIIRVHAPSAVIVFFI